MSCEAVETSDANIVFYDLRHKIDVASMLAGVDSVVQVQKPQFWEPAPCLLQAAMVKIRGSARSRKDTGVGSCR